MEPSPDCPLCPRLAAFRAENRRRHPDCHNAPVPTFGDSAARLLVVGLAPGLRGANRTGRPFTGDYAGGLLYETLIGFGFARGTYAARPDDGLVLVDARIVNAVRCVPPENRPTGAEIRTCNVFLERTIAGMPNLTAILALGRVAHEATLRALGMRKAEAPFAHAAEHLLKDELRLFDSYHCSLRNTATRLLTPEMFRDVFRRVRVILDANTTPQSRMR